MGLTPNQPNYAQLIQQQFQLQQQQQQQQFQQKTSTNNSETKREANLAPQLLTPSSMTHLQANPHVQMLKPTASIANSSPSSSISVQSSSYVPQVEAISPTPEDQKENSNLQALKDKICSEIEKVEKDFASTQYQLDMLKKKQLEIEEESQLIKLDESAQDGKCLQQAEERTSMISMTLAEKIYKENRKKAEESHREVLKQTQNLPANTGASVMSSSDASFDEMIPFYHEFSDTKISQEIRHHFDTCMKKRLIQVFSVTITLDNVKRDHMVLS